MQSESAHDHGNTEAPRQKNELVYKKELSSSMPRTFSDYCTARAYNYYLVQYQQLSDSDYTSPPSSSNDYDTPSSSGDDTNSSNQQSLKYESQLAFTINCQMYTDFILIPYSSETSKSSIPTTSDPVFDTSTNYQGDYIPESSNVHNPTSFAGIGEWSNGFPCQAWDEFQGCDEEMRDITWKPRSRVLDALHDFSEDFYECEAGSESVIWRGNGA